MHLTSFLQRRLSRAAIVLALVAAAVLGSNAMALAGAPADQPLPVQPDGGIGTTADDMPLPVEPDGGIGN